MNAALTLFTRFAGFIDSVKKTIAAASVPVQGRPARIPTQFGVMFHTRLSRLTTRLRDLLARIEAERTKPRPASAATPRPRAPRPAKPKSEPNPNPAPALPRGFGWITQPLPEANGHAHTLRQFLCEPETEALIASDPRIGRILRPLCHMLGIDLHLIYRMVPHHPDLTKRHPLLPENAKPRSNRPRKTRPKTPPPPPPLIAPTLDAVQSLLDRVFSPHHHSPGPYFFPPDDIYIHPK